jgi:hypothetical protein
MRKIKSLMTLWFLSVILFVPGSIGAENPPPTGPIYDIQTQLNDIEEQINSFQDQIANLPPTWSRKLPASERFEVLADFDNAAVLDKETGLVWEQNPSGPPSQRWEIAQQNCNGSNTGNRKGWRLPTLQELASLVDQSQDDPALPSGHPFSNVQSSTFDRYWSATAGTGDPILAATAWIVAFNAGGVGRSNIFDTNFSWCVRGGQGVNPQ